MFESPILGGRWTKVTDLQVRHKPGRPLKPYFKLKIFTDVLKKRSDKISCAALKDRSHLPVCGRR